MTMFAMDNRFATPSLDLKRSENDFHEDQTIRFGPSGFNMAAVRIVPCAYIEYKTKSLY